MIKVDDKDQGVTYQVYKSEIQTSNFSLNNSMLWGHFSKKKKKKKLMVKSKSFTEKIQNNTRSLKSLS